LQEGPAPAALRSEESLSTRVGPDNATNGEARRGAAESGAPRLGSMSQEAVELFLRGYRAFVAGDLEAIERMLDPDVEWVGTEAEAMLVSRDDVLAVLRERVAEGYHVTVDRAIGLADQAVVSMRFSRVEPDPTDERPLQTRRYYLVGRYAAVVHTRGGHVVRVDEHPHFAAALESVGLEDEVA
jgi:ketosteroid isomerase-like protein